MDVKALAKIAYEAWNANLPGNLIVPYDRLDERDHENHENWVREYERRRMEPVREPEQPNLFTEVGNV